MANPSRFDALVSEFAAALRQVLFAELQDDLARLRGGPKRARGRVPNPHWPRCPTCGKPAYPHTRPYCREHGKRRRAKKKG